MSDTLVRILRSIAQLIVGGALTGLVDQVVTDVPGSYAPYVALGFTLLVVLVQNLSEEFNLIATRRGTGGPVVE